VGGFKGAVNSRRRLKGANSRSRRAHIHGSKSAVATKIRGRLEYSRYMTYQARVVGPSGGTTRWWKQIRGSQFEGIPKVRDMKAFKISVLKA
jgi:hypothetical protein